MGKIILSEGDRYDVQQGGVSSVSLRKGGVFNLRLNTPVVQATSLFRKRNSEPLTAPSAEARFRACGHDQRTEPVWRLCDRPLETFARSLLQLCSDPTLAGRGGSVSRRDHSQAYRRRAHLTGGTNYVEVPTSNASRSSGEGVWGRGASLREAASPPESPNASSFREGARGRGLFYQKSLIPRNHPPYFMEVL